MSRTLTLHINGQGRAVEDVPPETPLLWVLRETLGLRGTKFGCGIGACGACTVHFNGRAVRSCVTPVGAATGAEIVTIEGLSPRGDHPVQAAWCEHDVAQCGYCQPGQIMTAAALLRRQPHPSLEEVRAAMSGNLCRCYTYSPIETAVMAAAVRLNAATTSPAP